MTSRFLTVKEVITIHDDAVNLFGGAPGIRDMGALESAVLRPQMGYYQDIIEEAAAMLESIVMNHPFVDGNKRAAFYSVDTFLSLNNRHLQIDDQATYDFFIGLFERQEFRYEHLEPWIRKHLK